MNFLEGAPKGEAREFSLQKKVGDRGAKKTKVS
jgi:hypothetical protein